MPRIRMRTSTNRTPSRTMKIMAHGHHGGPPHESPWVVCCRWSLLAIPSIIIGALTVQPLLFGGGFGESIFLNAEHHEMLHEIGASSSATG